MLALRLIPEQDKPLVHDKAAVEETLGRKVQTNSEQYELMHLNNGTTSMIGSKLELGQRNKLFKNVQHRFY